MTETEWAIVIAWGTVVLGLIVTLFDLRAVLYFWHARKVLKGNFVYESTFATVWQITVVCAFLTFNRFLFLAAGFQAEWMAVVTGVMAIGLLAIPVRKMREFQHGNGTGETSTQREDREAGNIRREEEE